MRAECLKAAGTGVRLNVLMANKSCYRLLSTYYAHVQGIFSSLDHLILAASIFIFPRFADEEIEALRGYKVNPPWKYLEAGVRKTDPWAKFASAQT